MHHVGIVGGWLPPQTQSDFETSRSDTTQRRPWPTELDSFIDRHENTLHSGYQLPQATYILCNPDETQHHVIEATIIVCAVAEA